MNKKKLPKISKKTINHVISSVLLEFGPVVIFLASFEHVRVYESTLILMIATIISTIATYHIQKRIPYLALYMAIITTIFGYMALHFHNIKFIQMRDTLYDVTASLTLITGILINVPFFKLIFGDVIPMTNRAWNKLTYLWIGYFILIAFSNEVVRRTFPLHVWFHFKGWIVFTTIVFGLLALYFSYEESEK